MSMFGRRRRHSIPELNMSSMPDMIFTVLFFFMIVTTMRETKLKVDYDMPQSDSLETVSHRPTVVYLHIGRPVRPEGGSPAAPQAAADGGVMVQLDDSLVNVADIAAILNEKRSAMQPDEASRLTVNIKADRNTPMGIVNDVKQALRDADVLDVVLEGKPNYNKK